MKTKPFYNRLYAPNPSGFRSAQFSGGIGKIFNPFPKQIYECQDGSFSDHNRRRACTRHGGIKNPSPLQVNFSYPEAPSQPIQNQRPSWEIDFEITCDTRKGIPFVARIVGVEPDGKFVREFVELPRQFHKNTVTVSGSYLTYLGEIIEERHCGSWKNEARGYYITLAEGEQVFVAGISETKKILRVKDYILGKITADELLGRPSGLGFIHPKKSRKWVL